MYEFMFIVCSMMVVFGVLAIVGDRFVNYLMEKKGVSWDDEN